MIRLVRSLVRALAVVLPGGAAAIAAGGPAVTLPPKDAFHLFLLIGQSNMAGRGEVAPEDRVPPPRVLTLDRDGEWVPAVDPLHFDKPIAGVGPGRTFGRVVAAARPGITIGLIPCAVGGSPIDSWQPGVRYDETGAHPWDDALRRAHRALEAGTLQAILWHQGESDAKPALAPGHAAKLDALIARWRTELRAPDVPFLVGQLGRFDGAPWDAARLEIDRAHRETPHRVARTVFVPSDGLQDKGDRLHFDAAAARELGRRYAEAYLTLTGAR